MPSELGELVNRLLVDYFPDILNVEFTANMESSLDAIELGQKDWMKVLEVFYEAFERDLEKAKTEIGDLAVDLDDLVTYAMFPVTGKKFLQWKYGLEDPPESVKPNSLEKVKKRDELVKKALAGELGLVQQIGPQLCFQADNDVGTDVPQGPAHGKNKIQREVDAVSPVGQSLLGQLMTLGGCGGDNQSQTGSQLVKISDQGGGHPDLTH